ncbi:MAG: 6-carboxytetrahydropterin synthase [Chlamydiia bacterium]|nr:6-carboxytetrahydropterin synthase [Chlamydiia bacterium]
MAYFLRKTFTFCASHLLEHHQGLCGRLHGHTYVVDLVLKADTLKESGPETNMVMDFEHVSKAMEGLMKSHLDHCHLNDTLETDSPSAEFIAHWIYQRLKETLPILYEVCVHESPTSCAAYRNE